MLETLYENSHFDVIVLNPEKPFEESFDLLTSLKCEFPEVEIVFVTRFDATKLCGWKLSNAELLICSQNPSTSQNYHEFSYLQSKSIVRQRHRNDLWLMPSESIVQGLSADILNPSQFFLSCSGARDGPMQ